MPQIKIGSKSINANDKLAAALVKMGKAQYFKEEKEELKEDETKEEAPKVKRAYKTKEMKAA